MGGPAGDAARADATAPRAPLSIYRFSSWARATIVPLLLLMNDRPVRPVPAAARLRSCASSASGPAAPRNATDRVFFARVDRALHYYHRCRASAAARARAAAERWVVTHQEADGSWGGIQPPTVYSLMALHALGTVLDHPPSARASTGCTPLDDPPRRRRACGSRHASRRSGTPRFRLSRYSIQASRPAIAVERAARWLSREEVRVPGDWWCRFRSVEPSGWAFEFENDLYPDVDDTAVVLIGLHRAGALDDPRRTGAVRLDPGHAERERRLGRVRQGQHLAACRDDPFCDFGEVIDPPSADVTAHVLEALGVLGSTRAPGGRSRAASCRAAGDGRLLVRPLGSESHLRNRRRAAGARRDRRADGYLACGARFAGSASARTADGGFGESCASYVDPTARGRGPSTPRRPPGRCSPSWPRTAPPH